MNKQYSEQNKKDVFIKALLPYLIGHIEQSADKDNAAKEMASLMIFPYKSDEGIKIGSLNEPGTSWYFLNNSTNGEKKADSYRIFADDLFEKDYANMIKNKLRDYGLASDFSDSVVIKNLLERMSMESTYSETWWSCAYDVLKLWNPEEFSVKLTKATAGIKSKRFLFTGEYCDKNLREMLLKHGVFEDIIDDVAYRIFWNRLIDSEKKKAFILLEDMGVPCNFLCDGTVNASLLEFAKKIGYNTPFPVSQADAAYERCVLSYKIFMDKIYHENRDALVKAVNDSNANIGILLKNKKGQFVPLSWDLYYSENDFLDNTDTQDAIYSSETEKYECLHIDVKGIEPGFVSNIHNVHEFKEVELEADEYQFGIDYDAISFYRWIWGYSQHFELARNVLSYYTNDVTNNNSVNEFEAPFVLDIIESDHYSESDFIEDFRFDILIKPEEAFERIDTINAISRGFSGLFCLISGKTNRKNVKEYVNVVIKHTYTSNEIKEKIKKDSIWDNVCVVEGSLDDYAGLAVIGKTNYFNKYQDAIFLWPSSDSSAYIRAIAIYIKEKYLVDVASELVDDIDWKSEYVNLVRNIRSRLAFHEDTKSHENIFRDTVDLEDIRDFSEEKRIWDELKRRRDELIGYGVGGKAVKISSHREFLSAKYSGRCQLCGGRIEMGEQKSYFWTYRIVKEKENHLANSRSNLFCLCPSCHGEMRFGWYMGQDFSEVVKKANQYAQYIETIIDSGEYTDDMQCLVGELAEENVLESYQVSSNDEDSETVKFKKPIVCKVVVGGEERNMFFSWEHFIRLSFIFSHTNDFEENEYEEAVMYNEYDDID
ncbi:MAG: hypothetical protein IJR29_04525 [Butyrivibrio sp.]|nr:hypothetical protein [Butyrivibrio sp.]